MATRQFRRELRRWRTRKGLTQRALADRVRFSRETVAAVESGRRYGSQELAVRCDEVLGTGGLLTALWPRVAVEQLAADGRRGPRMSDLPRADPAGADPRPGGAGSVARDPRAVVAAIDELRELIDRMLRVHFPTDNRRSSAETHRSPAEIRRSSAETLRRTRADILGHRR